MKFTLSSDPEFFLTDSSGKFISSCDRFGGDKFNPRKVMHGFIQEDNVALEMNPFPSSSLSEFVNNHCSLFEEIQGLAKNQELLISKESFAEFEEDQLWHPSSRASGCNIDFNAWEDAPIRPPNLFETQERSCAGHLHLGWEDCPEDVENEGNSKRIELVKILDLTHAVPAVLIENNNKRKKLYGKAGSFRYKSTKSNDPYNGVEYRSLSNFWVFSKETLEWVFNSTVFAFERFCEFKEIIEIERDRIISTINNHDKSIAQELVKTYNLEVANV